MRLIFAIPGDLDALTGGYGYDREIIKHMAEFGIRVVHCPLPGNFPHPSPLDARDAVQAINAGLESESAVLMDGLAFGVFPEAAIMAIKAPLAALCHHPLGFETGLRPERSRALLKSEKRALALADHVIVTSDHTARTLISDFDVPKDRISIAPPGTEPARRAEGSGKTAAILGVGSITPRKAFAAAVEALAGLQGLEWHLNIAGGFHHAPEYAAALRALILERGLQSRVTLMGEYDREALDQLYHRSDIFVSPSLHEGYGMALAEAMARGLPIAMAAGGAAAETVPDRAALKVPPGDIPSLRAALRSLIVDRALRTRLAQASWMAGQRLTRWPETAGIIAAAVRRTFADTQKRR
jgi:glycosyltransferase involved in cell wall biosynthesis